MVSFFSAFVAVMLVSLWLHFKYATSLWKWLLKFDAPYKGSTIVFNELSVSTDNTLDPASFLESSRRYLKKTLFQTALDYAVKAYETAPRSWEAALQCGICSSALGKSIDAYLYYEKSMQNAPETRKKYLRNLQNELLFTYDTLLACTKTLWGGQCDALVDVLDSDDDKAIGEYIKSNFYELEPILLDVSRCLRLDAVLVGPWYLSSWSISSCDSGTFILSRTVQVAPEFIARLPCVYDVIIGLRDVTQIGWAIHHGVAKHAAMGLVILASVSESETVAERATEECFWFISAWLQDRRSDLPEEDPLTPVCGCYQGLARHSALTWLERLIETSPNLKKTAEMYLTHPEALPILIYATLATRDEKATSTALPQLLLLPGVVEWVATHHAGTLTSLYIDGVSIPPSTPVPVAQWVAESLLYLIAAIDNTDHMIFTPLGCKALQRLLATSGGERLVRCDFFPVGLYGVVRLASGCSSALKLLGAFIEDDLGGDVSMQLRDTLLGMDVATTTWGRKSENIAKFGGGATEFFDFFEENGGSSDATIAPHGEAWDLTEALEAAGKGGKGNHEILERLTREMSCVERRKLLVRRVLRLNTVLDEDDTVFIECNRSDSSEDGLKKIVEDLRNSVGVGAANLTAFLEVRFTNETSTGSAVSREWADHVAKSVFLHPSLSILEGDAYYYSPNPLRKFISPTWEEEYTALGRLYALCIWNKITVDLPIHPKHWELILKCYTGDGLEGENEPFPHASVGFLTEMTDTMADLNLELNFTKFLRGGDTSIEPRYYSRVLQVDDEVPGPFDGTCYEELIVEGRDLPVTDETRQKYCDLMNKLSVSRELQAIHRGFSSVFSSEAMKGAAPFVTGQHLADITSGSHTISVADWRENTVLTGWGADDSNVPLPVKFFWETLETFTQQQLSKVLQYVTGSRRAPHGGFAHLIGYNGGKHKFTLCNGAAHLTPESYPTAHACVCTLDLPPWVDGDIAGKRVRELTEFENFRFDEHE